MHGMVDVIAKARVKQQNLAWGRGEELEKRNLAQEVTFVRRRISAATVICFGQRLAGRMSQVGPGAAVAGARRQGGGREEERARRERESSWLEKVSVRDIVRRGQFWSK